MGVRFAPSPTGRFHLGNLRTAWISQAWARALGLPWVVRMEDIDQPRVLAGAQAQQLADLEAFGLVPDELVLQTSRRTRHLELFLQARESGQIYPCFCSRKEVQAALLGIASAPHGAEAVYSGHCRAGGGAPAAKQESLAWRFRGEDPSGAQDFLVARTAPTSGLPSEVSFVPAYHWACAIDDIDGGYALLVRAWDLRAALEPQRSVQVWLAQAEKRKVEFPAVFHATMVTGAQGERLEKRSRGITLPELLAAGWSAERLAERFRRTCHEAFADYSPGLVWGEARPVLSLAELLAV